MPKDRKQTYSDRQSQAARDKKEQSAKKAPAANLKKPAGKK
jgi:hypothetical protein